MEKVYYLLRNNLELGPFTKRQLLKQSLKPKDLIWVEGESVSWQYPHELASLTPQQSDSIKTKKRRAFPGLNSSFTAPIGFSTNHQFHFNESRPNGDAYSSSINLPGGDALELIIHKKNRKTISWDGLIGVAFVTLLVAIAWHGRHQFFTAETSLQIPAVKPVVSFHENNFEKAVPPARLLNYVADTMTSTKNEAVNINRVAERRATLRKESTSADIVEANPSSALETAVVSEAKPETIPLILTEQKPINPDTETKAAEEPELASAALEINAETVEKRKGFGSGLKGLFKKKKKTEEITTATLEQ